MLTPVATIANIPFRRKFFSVGLSVRLLNNTLNTEVDITKFVKEPGISKLKKSVDTNDFNIGFFKETNITLVCDNSENRFMDSRGFFKNGVIDGSVIRVVAGYVDPEDETVETEVAFEGVIEGKGTVGNSKKEERRFMVLSFSSVIRKLQSKSGAAVSGQTFQNAFSNLLNVQEVLRYLTIDIANINPKVNLTIDEGSFFIGKSLQESIDALILASNSIMVIRDNAVHIIPRDENPTVDFEYFGKGSNTPANVMDISGQTDGDRRLITSVLVQNQPQPFNASTFVIDRYGFRQKELDLGFMTDPAKIETIALNIIDEFQIPKPELFIRSPYIGNQLDIMSLATIDNRGYNLDVDPSRYSRNFKYSSGATYVIKRGGLRYSDKIGWKVLSIEHDFNKFTTTVGLRQKGNEIGDNLIA